VETVEGERGPGAIPDEPFEASSVGGLDADAGALPHAMHALRGGPGVEAKAAAVIPGQLREEPKRCRKLTAPMEAVAGAVGDASLRVAWRARREMRMIVLGFTSPLPI